MTPILRALFVVPLFALAGCMGTTATRTAQMAPAPMMTPAVLPVVAAAPGPAEINAGAQASTSVLDFIDPAALPLLNDRSRSAASTAQYNALQFGRPGAPRNWKGEGGSVGLITVGPYVRVNALDCRDFTHTVTADGKSFALKGTACRETDGRWAVAG
jgi:surface antigen